MEPLSASLGQSESSSISPEGAEQSAVQDSRSLPGSKDGALAGAHSQGPKDPPERWGEFFTRTGAGPGGRGVGGKGVKRHPSNGEDVVIRSGARFSPPARGFGSSRGFPRARSPDDAYPPAENMSRKGRSMVLERGFNDLRSRRGSAPLGNPGGHGANKGEKHGGGENRGLWPLVVGLQGEGQESWRRQEDAAQKPGEHQNSTPPLAPPRSDWGSWLDRSRQLSKDNSELGDNDSHSSDEICFGPVQRRRLSEDLDLPDAPRVDDHPSQEIPSREIPFSFSPPPGFGPPATTEPARTPRAVPSAMDSPPPPVENPFSVPFSFNPSPRGSAEANPMAAMDTDAPPPLLPSPPPPRAQRSPRVGRSLLSDSDEADEFMPGLLGPSLDTPPPPLPVPHFGLPPPGPRNHFSINRRGPGGSLPPQTGSASSRGAERRPGPPARPPPAWLQNRGSWEGWESDNAVRRQRAPVSDGGRPFVDDGVGAMFSHAEPPGMPFTLLPVPKEPGEQSPREGPPRPRVPPPYSPGLFDGLDPLRQLRRLSPGERPREAYQDGFEDGSPVLHRERTALRLERRDSPPTGRRHVAPAWHARGPRQSELYDDWDAWEEQVDMDSGWWDVEAGGLAPERRNRSPPRRASDPGFGWLDDPLWEGGGENPLDEAGGGQRQNADRGGALRRRRFSLFDEEGGAVRVTAPALEAQATESPAGAERIAGEERAARRRGRSWLRELGSLEGASARQPGAPATDANRSAREGLFGLRRGGGPAGAPAPRNETEAVLGRPPVYRNLREFLTEAGGAPGMARRTPAVAEESAPGGGGLAGLFREAGEDDGEAAVGRARARRHRARMFEAGREGGLPTPLLAMLNALEEAEQFQDLTGDQLIRLQIALSGGGMSARRRRELDAMRVDVDRMTYEELLELEERIGNVSVGLSPETVVEKLPITKWAAPITGDEKEIKCVVCQVEYEESEDVRILPCTHCYHADCIKSWLATKNECPVCKAKAVP